jgi:uncharacterized membrane protein
VWRNGTYTFLDVLPGFAETFWQHMNDRGTIVAGSASENEGNQGPHMPLIWQNGTIMPLGRPPGFLTGFAMDINDRGTVVLSPPFTWQAGQFTKLTPPDAQHLNQLPSKLNNQGIVTGDSYQLRDGVLSSIVATLWLDGYGTDMNWLISGQDPLRPLVRADGGVFINDRNQVLIEGSSGSQNGYYLLTPVR